MDNFRIWDVKIYDPIGNVLRSIKLLSMLALSLELSIRIID
jgi:hypothetical protein